MGLQDTEVLLKDLLREEFDCAICLDNCSNTHINPDCGHRFCGDCIKTALRSCRKECPSCRLSISTYRTLRQDKQFDRIIEKISNVIAFIQASIQDECMNSGKDNSTSVEKQIKICTSVQNCKDCKVTNVESETEGDLQQKLEVSRKRKNVATESTTQTKKQNDLLLSISNNGNETKRKRITSQSHVDVSASETITRSEEDQKVAAKDDFALHSRVLVWWPYEKQYFAGTINNILPNCDTPHHIIYDDGDEEYTNLNQRKVKPWEGNLSLSAELCLDYMSESSAMVDDSSDDSDYEEESKRKGEKKEATQQTSNECENEVIGMVRGERDCQMTPGAFNQIEKQSTPKQESLLSQDRCLHEKEKKTNSKSAFLASPQNEANHEIESSQKLKEKSTHHQVDDWDKMFRRLVEYRIEMKRRNLIWSGHVSNKEKFRTEFSAELAEWTKAQRQAIVDGSLAFSRIEKLTKLGFNWQLCKTEHVLNALKRKCGLLKDDSVGGACAELYITPWLKIQCSLFHAGKVKSELKEQLDFLVGRDWINLRDDRSKICRNETKTTGHIKITSEGPSLSLSSNKTIDKDMATSHTPIEPSIVHDSNVVHIESKGSQNPRIPRKKKSMQSLLRGGSTPISTSISSIVEGNTIISKKTTIPVSTHTIKQSDNKHSASRQSLAIDELPSMVRLIIKNLISSNHLDYFPSIETCKLLTNLSTSDALGGLMEFQRGRPVKNKEDHLKSVLEKIFNKKHVIK